MTPTEAMRKRITNVTGEHVEIVRGGHVNTQYHEEIDPTKLAEVLVEMEEKMTYPAHNISDDGSVTVIHSYRDGYEAALREVEESLRGSLLDGKHNLLTLIANTLSSLRDKQK